jgi:hypothetical protein
MADYTNEAANAEHLGAGNAGLRLGIVPELSARRA